MSRPAPRHARDRSRAALPSTCTGPYVSRTSLGRPAHVQPGPARPVLRTTLALALPVTTALSTGLLTSLAASASGLSTNGDFETGTAGWYAAPAPTGGAQPLSRTTVAHSGGGAAQVTNVTGSAVTAVLNDAPNTVGNTAAGQTYRASAWLRASTPGTSLVLRMMEFAGGAQDEVAQRSVWATDTAWHQLTVELTATRSGATVDVNALAWGLGAGQSFSVDDVDVNAGTAASPTPTPTPPPAPVPRPGGVLPAQGTGALFGYYQAGGVDPRPMEASIGRRLDLVHHYSDFNGSSNLWPNAAEQGEAAEGRTVHIGWELQSYTGGYDAGLQPAPEGTSTDLHGNTRRMWTYSQVSNGSLDRYLDAVANRARSAPGQYIVDIDHEMDDRPDVGGAGRLRAATGSRAEYVAAYRHIVDRFRARGVTNVTWAWTVSGWYASDSSKAWSLQQLWPGSDYVNMIMWDPYNYRPNSWRSFADIVAPFYGAITRGVLDPVDTNAKRLPLGLAEYGCMPDPRRPDWLRAIPAQAKAFPALVSLGYFSSGSWGSLQGDQTSITAFGDAGRSPYLHTRG